jgi:glyoxylase-like metal-dependent hydrolase (beta-lactamase superfamily II)
MRSDHEPVDIEVFTLGPWETNCHVVTSPSSGSKDCWIIDAGFDPELMIESLQKRGLNPVKLLLTHAHIDHIAGIPQIRDAFGSELPILIHENEKDFLTDPMLNLSGMLAMPLSVPAADGFLEDGETLQLGDATFTVLYTPGHSPGSVTFYHPESGNAIVGDTLFAGSIGRYDFPTSNGPLLFKAIRERLLTLPERTNVYPGHGPATTVGEEKRTNPFVGEHASAATGWTGLA